MAAENHSKDAKSKIPVPSRHRSTTEAPTFKNASPKTARRNSTSELATNDDKQEFDENDKNVAIQLVSPSDVHDLENYTATTAYETFYANLKRGNPRDSLASTSGEQDFYNRSLDIPNANINPSFSSLNISELGRPNEGGKTTRNESESGRNRIPSTPKEKNRMFRAQLTKIMSCIYAVFIVTLGIVVYITDIIVGNSPIAETFSMYLIVISFVYVTFLIIDIRIYVNKKKKQKDPIYHFPASDSEFEKSLEHRYCFSRGRHSGSFFLKLGAAGISAVLSIPGSGRDKKKGTETPEWKMFCLGHLIHSGLLLGYQIIFLTSKTEACASVATLVLDIIYPSYSFLLLYFIFKYSNVIINRNPCLTRFAFMHCIASSICFWVWTILRETMDALAEYKNENSTKTFAEIEGNMPFAIPLAAAYSEKGGKDSVEYFNGSLRISFGSCLADEGLAVIYQNYSPYLYPFSVEYSILVVGILFIIWQNISECKMDEDVSSNSSVIITNKECNIPHVDSEESNFVIHADCHSANRGLFGGIIVFVICVVNIILYFIGISDERYTDVSLLVVVLTDIILLVIMTIAAIIAYRQITKLDINSHAISLLDDLLLFICIPAFFLSAIFSIVPALQSGNALSIVSISAKVLQMLVQTPLIIDGLRRCSISRELRQQKPGRELITFLIVCNVSMWITQTFEVKSYGLQDLRYDFYGKFLWTILGHMTLPLMMFYRFHSAVCLVDIWKSAYEKDGHRSNN